MSKTKRLPPPPEHLLTPSEKPAEGSSSLEVVAPADIPPHVWSLLQEAGEAAAERLRDLLQPHAFNKLAGSVQRSLLDLALTRAYGLPVRRSVSLDLSSSDADAVAASLASLADSLPERSPEPRDITPHASDYPTDDLPTQ